MNPPALSPAAVAPFFLSSFAWNFALGMTYLLIPLRARELGMSGVQIGMLLASPVALQVFFNLLGGAFTDRFGGKSLARVSCMLTVVAGVTFMFSNGFVLMFIAQLMMVMGRAMFWPATWSLASQLPGEQATQMGRLNGATNAGQIMGTAASGFIIVSFGFAAGFGTLAFAGLIALVLNQMFRHAQPRPRGKPQPILATYRMLLGKPSIRYSVMLAYISALPVSLSLSFYPILLVEQGLNSDTAGSLLSLRAVGAIAAGFVVGHLIKQVRNTGAPMVSAIMVGGSVVLGAAVTQPPLIAFFMLVLGAGSAVMSIYFQMLISQVSTTETRGSAMALGGLGWGISHLSTPLVMGVLKDWLDIHWAFYLMGGFVLALCAVLGPLQRWAFREHAAG